MASDVRTAICCANRIAILVAVLMTAVIDARAEVDPIALQQQAIASLDAWRERAWRAPQLQVDRSVLSAAEAQLEQSNRALEARGDWPHLVTGLIRQGKARCLLTGSHAQLAVLRCVAQVAVKANDVDLEAWALSGKAHIEIQTGDLGQAVTDVNRALKLATTSRVPEIEAKALSDLGLARLVCAATETAQREVGSSANSFAQSGMQ